MRAAPDFRRVQTAEKALIAAMLFFAFSGTYVLLPRAGDDGLAPERKEGWEPIPRVSALSGFEGDREGPLLQHNLFVSARQAQWRPDPLPHLMEEADLSAAPPPEESVAVPDPPEPPPAPPDPPPVPPRRIEVRYAGMLRRLDGQHRALLAHGSNGTQNLLKVGDRFEGFEVERIHRNALQLIRNGEQISLPLNIQTLLEAQ